MKKITFLLLFAFSNIQLSAQATLIDTFAFEWTNNFNSFWGTTDVNGQLHLGSDGPGDIFVINSLGEITSTITTPLDYNHGMVWDGTNYWVAEDFSTGGAGLTKLDETGTPLSGFILPPLIGGNTSGVGDLSLDGDGIWFSVYYPDFDVFPFGYAYKINPNTQAILDTIPLHGQQVYGIASHGDHIFYVTDDLNGDEERIYAYSKSLADTLFSFPLLDPDGDSSPRGLHWFDNHLWLLAKRPGSSAFAYSMLYKYQINLGAPLVPQMSLTKDSLNFGLVTITENSALDFYLKNEGTGQLDISNISSDDLDFTISSGPSLPFSVAVGDSVLIGITFSPTLEQDYNNTLTISSNSNSAPVQNITLTGVGILPLAIHDIENQIIAHVFPNPSSEFLQLDFKASEAMVIQILINDIQGRFIKNVYDGSQKITEKKIHFEVASLSKGNYFLTIKNEGAIIKTIHFVKE